MKNFRLAMMLAIGYDLFQFIGEASVVALVGLAIVPFLPFLQVFVTLALWRLTGTLYPFLVFIPEEIPVLSMLPMNTAAVVLAKNKGKLR